MSVYKVPQDVEAEDKLLGPFSFRQFIFLIIAIASLGIAYALGQALLPLALLPLPVALFFGALALPLKKDQPMEVYLAAIISFMMKPKRRLWQPDGKEFLVEVTAPKVEEKVYGSKYDQEEVQRRLSYLANLVDSRGWSIRGVSDPDSPMQADLYNEAQRADDLLDEGSATAQNIERLVNESDVRRREEAIQRMNQATTTPQNQVFQATPADDNLEEQMASSMHTNPYPSMHQSTLSPISQSPAPPTNTQQTIPTDISPAIMDLANNHQDLSIETLQREANRIASNEKKKEMEEVVISLR